jgi:hypothetical protein
MRPSFFPVCFLVCMIGRSVVAEESISIELKDGRTVTGMLDRQTDVQRLWLRMEEAGIQLASGYAWPEIERIFHEQRPITAEELQRLTPRLATSGKLPHEIALFPASFVPSASMPTMLDRAQEASAGRLVSLQIQARLGQWNADALSDGLWVSIYPLNAQGELTPVSGQVELTLLGEVDPARAARSELGRPGFQELSRHHVLVRPSDFARGPAVVQFPFHRFHPDLQRDIAPQAVLHARLGVSGQGVFEATAADVALRPLSRMRDQLQLHTGSRFFPVERISGREP